MSCWSSATELTSGSTWHAAGGFHTLNGDPNVAKLQGYTIALYDELEKISGQSCGLHRSGGLMLADTQERMEWLKMAHARARYLGLETELISTDRRPRSCSRCSRRSTSSAPCSTPPTAISIPPAPPTPMPSRRASTAPKST